MARVNTVKVWRRKLPAHVLGPSPGSPPPMFPTAEPMPAEPGPRRSARVAARATADKDPKTDKACEENMGLGYVCTDDTCSLGPVCMNRVRPTAVRIKVCDNPRKGLGLFSTECIPAGHPVAEFGPTKPVADEQVPEVVGKIGYILTHDGQSWQPRNNDASFAHNAMIANHQCEGAFKSNVELVPGEVDEHGCQTFYLRATEDIGPEVEIVYCYSKHPGFRDCFCRNCWEDKPGVV